MNKKLTILILFFALFTYGKAQVYFASSELSSLYARLPEPVKKDIIKSIENRPDACFDAQINLKGRELVVSIDNSKINQLGFQLNALQFAGTYDSIVKAFIERALLRLSLDKTISDMVNTSETMQLTISFLGNDLRFAPIRNFDELLNIIFTATSFNLAKDNYLFVAEWRNNDQVLKFKFPNNFQLLTGKNKLELDEELCLNLGRMIVTDLSVKEAEKKAGTKDSLPIISVVKGSKFMDLLSSDVSYKHTGNDSILVFEPSLISYSVPNLFLNKEITGNRTLHLSHQLFGEKTKTYNLSLQNFIKYFESDFQSFIGMENSSPDVIEGTVVLSHKYFNFIHLLHFKTNSSEIFNYNGVIETVFYSNIPLHNVGNLFKEFKPDTTNQKIDVNINKP